MQILKMYKIKSFYNEFLKFLSLIRYWQWQEKIQVMSVCVMLLLIYDTDLINQRTIIYILLMFLYTFFLLSYAYILNSYIDRNKDLLVKKNYFLDFSDNIVKFTAILLGVITLLIPLSFKSLELFLYATLLFFLATFYSMPPLRLKEKGIIGIIVASFTQRAPFLFLYFFIEHTYIILYLFGWLLLISFIMEITHQISDFYNDLRSNTMTYVVKRGVKNARSFIYILTFFLMFYITFLYFIIGGAKGLISIFILFLFSHHSVHYAAHYIGKYKNNTEDYGLLA